MAAVSVKRSIAPRSTKTINENRTVVDQQEDKFFFCTFSRSNDFAFCSTAKNNSIKKEKEGKIQ